MRGCVGRRIGHVWPWALVFFCTHGCGRIGYGIGAADSSVVDAALDADIGLVDSAVGDSAPVDAAPDAGALGPFGPPRQLTEIFDGSHSNEDPTISSDGLEMIYVSNDAPSGGANDLWVTTRASIDDVWGAPRALDINSGTKDQTPSLSEDGLTLWFSSGRAGAGDDDIYVTTRSARTAGWTAPVPVAELGTTREDRGTSPFAGGLGLLFGRADDTSGPFDIFATDRGSTSDPWSMPVMVTELDSAADDRNPHVSPDGTRVYFASDRAGGMGGLDIWSSQRASRTSAWEAPSRVSELNSTANDDDPTSTADLRILIVSSEREGTYRLYEFRR